MIVLQYILTCIAGIAVGVVAMRIWQAQSHPIRLAGNGAEQVERKFSFNGFSISALRPAHFLVGASILLVAALITFSLRDDNTDPLASLGGMPTLSATDSPPPLDDVETMIDRLSARLEQNPDDGEGFRMLGWSYVMTDQPQLAIAPYERALELIPDNASVHAGYGEALTAIADNQVTPAAKSAFNNALMLDGSEPRSRYFLSLWDAQNGREQAALDAWVDLANGGPADAPWQIDVRREIDRVSAILGVDGSGNLAAVSLSLTNTEEPPALDSATLQAGNLLPESQRQSMIDGMVEGLAERLSESPNDPDGWIRLIRSRMVLEQSEQANTDLQSARQALVAEPLGLDRVNAAAVELGVPGA